MWAYDLAFLILGGRRHFRQRGSYKRGRKRRSSEAYRPSAVRTVWQNSRLAACALQPARILQNGSVACDYGGEKGKPGLAGLTTSPSCPIAREQPTIKQLPIGETS